MKRGFFLGVLFLTAAGLSATDAQAQECKKELKFATIAPQGSAWDQITNDLINELKTRTGGALCIRNYAGGVQGDEKTVVQKIRIGQLDGAGFTGFGAGLFAPAIRLLEAPIMFRSGAEVDLGKERMDASFTQALANANPPLVNLGWAEAGFVYLLTKKPVRTLEDMKGVKMWQWEGDPLAAAMFKEAGVTPVQLTIGDVLSSFQTGLVEGVYGPPLALLALQWAPKGKYLTNLPITNSTGVMVLAKKTFDGLSPDLQKTLLEVTRKYTKQIVERTRLDNEKALEQIKKLGIEIVEVDPKARENFDGIAVKVRAQLVGQLYSAEQLKTAEQLLAEYRSKGSSSAAAQKSQ